MTAWTSDDLNKIGTADELEIVSVRRDGTLTKPVTIWVVRVGDDLYVRSYKGHGDAWFRAAQARHEGRVRAGGVEKDVTLARKPTPALTVKSTLPTIPSTAGMAPSTSTLWSRLKRERRR